MTTETQAEIDRDWMMQALLLARSGLGQVKTNPAVGCVLVRGKDGLVGRGATKPGGRPHAETEALDEARTYGGPDAARGATAYVTLEPCSHQGKTPPCADALIAAGVSRVVVALGDPDPRVNGGGFAKLRAAGVEVVEGVCREEVADQLLGYLTWLRTKRPAVTLKLATSLDGKIATAGGQSKWITGKESCQLSHWLRAEHDAILTGRGTIDADDPALTCRLKKLEWRSPMRVVLDSKVKSDRYARFIATASDVETLIITNKDTPIEDRSEAVQMELATEITVTQVAGDSARRVSLPDALTKLGERGITSVLVEAGTGVATSFLRENLVDKLVWFRAPIILGNDGRPAIGALDIANLAAAKTFRQVDIREVGKDIVETYRRGV